MYRSIAYSSRERAIKLGTWDENGKRITETIPFSPYFYVETTSPDYDIKSIFGTNLKKREYPTDFERRQASQSITRCFHNLPVEQQFLIDRYRDSYNDPEFIQHPLKVAFLDIEVYSPDEFPKAEQAKHPINLITVYDNITDTFYTWGLEKDFTPQQENSIYYKCSTERELLRKFLKYWQEDYCDIVSGWNSAGFDLPYIINRITNVLGDEYARMLSPVGALFSRSVFIQGRENIVWRIRGIACIDYMEIYKTFARGERESYSLNYIAEFELDESKTAYNATSLADLAVKDWSLFVIYNIQDVNLLVRLEKKLQYLGICRMLATKGLCSFENALGKVAIIAGCTAIEALNQGRVIPTFNTDTTRRFEGAFVKDPERGLQRDIVSFDANSLYPNTVITLNISPETKVGKIIDKSPNDVTILLPSGQEVTITNDKFLKFVQQEKIAITRAKILYSQKKKGIIPQLIDSIYAERVEARGRVYELRKQLESVSKDSDEYKKHTQEIERVDNLQFTLKILLNSIYGALSNSYSPISDTDGAESITLTGQACVKQAAIISDKFFKEKYGIDTKVSLTKYQDTDSLYLSLSKVFNKLGIKCIEDKKVTPEAKQVIDELDKELNTEINNWARAVLNTTDPRYVFKREVIADVGLFLQKKRYILHVLDDEGIAVDKFKYTGVEIARSSTSKEVKELIKSVIETALLTQDQKQTNDKFDIAYDKFQEMDIDTISFRGNVNNVEKYAELSDGFRICKRCPNNVKGVINHNELLKSLSLTVKYETITSGTKIKKVYTKKNNRFNIDTLCYIATYPEEFADLFDIDYDKMFTKIVVPGIKAVYEAINWRLPSLQKTHSNLFELFGDDSILTTSQVEETTDDEEIEDDDDSEENFIDYDQIDIYN